MCAATISAQTVVSVSAGQARSWFLSLDDHPERYRFGTHDGFEIVQGSFGDVGSRFKTREKFYFLKLELLFELIKVDEISFRFRLIHPSWPQVWGSFTMRELEPASVSLQLEIGPTTRLGSSLSLVDPQGTTRLLGTLEVVWTEGFGTRSIIAGEAGLVFNGIGVEVRLGYGGQGPLVGQSDWSLGGTLLLGPVDIDYAYQEESVFGNGAHRLGIRLIL